MYNPKNTNSCYDCPYASSCSNSRYNPYDSHPYYGNTTRYTPDFSNEYVPFTDESDYDSQSDSWRSEMNNNNLMPLRDYGPNPFVVDIEEATKQNTNFRTALWTGKYLQLTLMSIDVGGEIGLENHPNLDQFIRIEEGQGIVKMGDRKDRLDFQQPVYADYAFIIPAGKWHNLVNTGNTPIKLYSIYAPPQHPYGTVHETKEDAEAAEAGHGH